VCSSDLGNEVDMTLFSPNEIVEFTKENILSKSFNTPFLGNSLKGKPLGILRKGHYVENF
jgi:dihydroorotase